MSAIDREYLVKMVKVEQFGFIEWVIKKVTGSKYCHAMIVVLNDDHVRPGKNGKVEVYYEPTFYGLDFSGREMYRQSEFPPAWKYDTSERTFILDFHPSSHLKLYSYSFMSNIHYLMNKVPFLRKYIKFKKFQTNCVGWISRVLSLERECELKDPGSIY